MTGAGFGGCAIALVRKDEVSNFTEKLTAHYHSIIGYDPGIFSSEVGEGVREIH
jgi:galactokinase